MTSIEFAINMEIDGEKYYREQAEKNKGNGLEEVFLTLSKEEASHAGILKKREKSSEYKLHHSDIANSAKSIFESIGDFKNEIKEIPDMLDVYRLSMEMEKESIKLYKKCLEEATDELEKELFKFLIQQEEDHYALIDELVTLVGRPEEWVENAEFGLRKEY